MLQGCAGRGHPFSLNNFPTTGTSLNATTVQEVCSHTSHSPPLTSVLPANRSVANINRGPAHKDTPKQSLSMIRARELLLMATSAATHAIATMVYKCRTREAPQPEKKVRHTDYGHATKAQPGRAAATWQGEAAHMLPKRRMESLGNKHKAHTTHSTPPQPAPLPRHIKRKPSPLMPYQHIQTRILPHNDYY